MFEPAGEDTSWHRMADRVFGDPEQRRRILQYAAACILHNRYEGVDLDVEPEDLVQQAAVVMLDGRLKWAGSVESMIGSVLRVISNECANLRRKQLRRAAISVGPITIGAKAASLEERLAIALDVHAEMHKLPAACRDAVKACLLADRTAAAYADAVGKSTKTVRNQLDRGRAGLRKNQADYAPTRAPP